MRGLALSTLPVALQLFVFKNAEYLHSKTQGILRSHGSLSW